ncbi:MAG: hypothetical protein EGQ86_27480 [Alistipes sp.]|nr:hypothetical protein [Alistipes sp.]MBE5689894.1 hypothetical protein [Alistipes sp.]MBE5691139.1 hypothetical protein [Alistipes sp.]
MFSATAGLNAVRKSGCVEPLPSGSGIRSGEIVSWPDFVSTSCFTLVLRSQFPTRCAIVYFEKDRYICRTY